MKVALLERNKILDSWDKPSGNPISHVLLNDETIPEFELDSKEVKVVPLKGWVCRYKITSSGKVWRNKRTVAYLKGNFRIYSAGWLSVSISDKNYSLVFLQQFGVRTPRLLARMVALQFIPNKKNLPCVSYRDGDKRNCSVSNLFWASHQESIDNSIKLGIFNKNRGSKKR